MTIKPQVITESWFRLIQYCSETVPHGWIKVQIVNGEPKKLLDLNAEVRFDKKDTIPKPDFGKE